MRPLPEIRRASCGRLRLNGFYKGAGLEDMANFVSKRLQRVAAAMLCLMVVQLAMSVASAGRAAPARVIAISK
jgi:hypothetical protein